MKKYLLLLSLLIVFSVMFSCGDAGGLSKREANVYVVVTDFSGVTVGVDIWGGEGYNLYDVYLAATGSDSITFNCYPLSPNEEDWWGAYSGNLMDVQFTSYTVEYNRADGGTAVPKSFREDMFFVVPFNGEAETNVFKLLRATSLADLPLVNLMPFFGGYDRETGSPIVYLTATYKLYGATFGGQSVKCSFNHTFSVSDY